MLGKDPIHLLDASMPTDIIAGLTNDVTTVAGWCVVDTLWDSCTWHLYREAARQG
jgi:hypothetical protein